MNFPVTPSAVERVLKLDGNRYFLASDAQAKEMGIKRAWDVKRVPRQDGDPTQEFTLPLSSFNEGYGYSFAHQPGVYEMAAGWDMSAPGKAVTWPRLTTAEAVTSVNYRGWIIWDPASGYMYMLRGSYATKYLPDDTTTEWPIIEYHYFGANVVVAGRPALFQGKWYVPLVDISTPEAEVLARWHELDTISTTTTETQVLTESGSPTGGAWVLSFNDGLTTTQLTGLAWDISAADLQTQIRTIPGLGEVTVDRSGASNFVWTVTMTGAPSALGTTSPPQFTVPSDTLTGGSGETVTPSTSGAGVGDRWDRAEAAVEARTFCTWQKPTVGPVLVRANANKVSTCSATPTTAANWGTEQEVGDSGSRINSLETLGRLLYTGKEDGVWSVDETGQAVNEIPAISSVRDIKNCVGMREWNSYLYIPHKLGLVRWRPGSNWSVVGAEQEGFYEGERSVGWGSVAGLAPYGKYLYQTINDPYNSLGVVGSLQSPGGQRGPLTPHMHQSFSAFVEDCAVVGIKSQPTTAYSPSTWSDDNAVGTITWSDTSNAGSDSGFATAAEGGQSHYLKGLNPNPQIPTGATIKGIKVTLTKQAVSPGVTSQTFTESGTSSQNYVVPAGVTSVTVDATGAQGGDRARAEDTGGLGGRVQTTISTTPAETLTVRVGVQGEEGHRFDADAADGSFLGGGDGGSMESTGQSQWTGGGGGGGASDIRRSSTELVVAGGGGGAGGSSNSAGGAGGGTTGGSGTNSQIGTGAGGGGGGTQSAGGAGGAAGSAITSPTAGSSGSSMNGGDAGDTANSNISAGGGGAGYFGGGGGGGPDGSGGGGSSYSSGSNTVHTQGYKSGNGYVTITAAEATNIVDTTVKLVKAGSVVGDNKASASQWSTTATQVSYGSGTDMWGTTWSVAEVNASNFGFVISVTNNNGTARIQGVTMTIYYTVAGVADPGSFMAVITLDATRTIATPYVYRLPRSGMPVANDPNIEKAISDASFKTARYAEPSRNVQKEYRGVEMDVELDPAVDESVGVQMWAALDDGAFIPLLDSEGDPATIRTNGSHEVFWPSTSAAVGHWVQLRPTIPAISGEQLPVSLILRDITVHGAWRPKMTDAVTTVIVLRESGQFEDGYSERRTVAQQIADLEALHDPRDTGQGPVTLHDPARREDGICVVSEVDVKPVMFKGSNEETWVAVVKLRKAVYA